MEGLWGVGGGHGACEGKRSPQVFPPPLSLALANAVGLFGICLTSLQCIVSLSTRMKAWLGNYFVGLRGSASATIITRGIKEIGISTPIFTKGNDNVATGLIALSASRKNASHTSPYYDMLCYAALCYALLYYVKLWYTMLCCTIAGYALVCYAIL